MDQKKLDYVGYPDRYLGKILQHLEETEVHLIGLLTEFSTINGNWKYLDKVLPKLFAEFCSSCEKTNTELEKIMNDFQTYAVTSPEKEKLRTMMIKEIHDFKLMFTNIISTYQICFATATPSSNFSKIGLTCEIKRAKRRIQNAIDAFSNVLQIQFENAIAREAERELRQRNYSFFGIKTHLIQDRYFSQFAETQLNRLLHTEYNLPKKLGMEPILEGSSLYTFSNNPKQLKFLLSEKNNVLDDLVSVGKIGWFYNWLLHPKTRSVFNGFIKTDQSENYTENEVFHEFEDVYAHIPEIKRSSTEFLVVDIETTGLELDHLIVEIGVALVNPQKKTVSLIVNSIVNEPSFRLYEHKNAWIFQHSSLTPEQVDSAIKLDDILFALQYLLLKYPVTAFNRAFDIGFLKSRGLVFAELLPCLMQEMTDVCQIPYYNDEYKWPSFDEAWSHYFKEPLEDTHRAGTDALNEGKLALKMIEENVLKFPVNSATPENDIKIAEEIEIE